MLESSPYCPMFLRKVPVIEKGVHENHTTVVRPIKK